MAEWKAGDGWGVFRVEALTGKRHFLRFHQSGRDTLVAPVVTDIPPLAIVKTVNDAIEVAPSLIASPWTQRRLARELDNALKRGLMTVMR